MYKRQSEGHEKDRRTLFVAGSAGGTAPSGAAAAGRLAVELEGNRAGGRGAYQHGDRVGPTLWSGRRSGPEIAAAGTAVLDGPDADVGPRVAGALDFGGRDAGATGIAVCAVEPTGGHGIDRNAVWGGDADSDGGRVSVAVGL